MAKKECELCSSPARMFCESDQASLCWDCDEKVHAANFLVAKHSRTLLCHVCRSPTTWKAAGAKLGPTVSICQDCVEDGENRGAAAAGSRMEDGDGGYDSQESESDDGEYYSDSEDFSEEEDGENQVVPWSATGDFPPPPPSVAASFSSCTEENISFSSSRRTRESPNFDSEDEDVCCSSPNLELKLSSQYSDGNQGSSSSSSLRPFKMRRMMSDSELIAEETAAGGDSTAAAPSGTAAVIEKLRRFQQELVTEGNASEMILGLCKLTRD